MRNIHIIICLISLYLISNGAQAHGGDSTLVHACIANSGVVKLVKPDEDCNGSWSALHWGIQGPPGPVDTELLGRISSLESQVLYLQSKISALEPAIISVVDVEVNEGNPSPGSYTGEGYYLRCNSPGQYDSGCYTITPVTVSLTKPASNIVTFDYQTIAQTATPYYSGIYHRDDYFGKVGVGTIPIGETSTTIDIIIFRDFNPEKNETLLFEIQNVSGAVIDDIGNNNLSTTSLITINNDDLPTLMISTTDSQHESQSFVSIDIGLSFQIINEVASIDYETVDDSAISGEDYVAQSGRIEFYPGDYTKTINIGLIDDTDAEGIHSFGVRFHNPVNILPSTITTTTVNIWDDDVYISINDVSQYEGNTGTDPYTLFTFNVTLSEPVEGRVVYGLSFYSSWPGQTTTFDDFGQGAPRINLGSTLIFEPGETLKVTTLGVIGDLELEDDETFVLPLRNVLGASIVGDGEGIGTILNDD
jgi:hypothetical protein